MRPRLCVLLFCAAVPLASCNRAPTVATYPISGKITLRGKALEGATVTFSNTNPDAPSAGATTDSQGNFRVSTYIGPQQVYSGAVAGDYAVVITKLSSAAASSGSDRMSKMQNASDEERQRIMQEQWQPIMDQAQTGSRKPKSEIPERYTNSMTTPLKVTVVVGENPPYDWDLTD